MITWPSVLPSPNVDFGIEVNSSTIRTKMDSGRIRQRKRFTRSFRTLSASWTLEDLEYAMFQSVYKSWLADGSDWFYMTLPMGDGIKEYRVRFIADKYSAKYDNVMHWNVSAKLETEDQVEPYDSETLDALEAIGFDVAAFEVAGDAYHELINDTLPSLD